MKKILFFLNLFIFSACSSSVGVFNITSQYSVNKDKYIVFENDTIAISYDFWFEKGLLSFAIYNKLNVPLYIDWKKSSYIENGEKLDYWSDTETLTSNSYATALTYKGNLIAPYYSLTGGRSITVGKKEKQERITFIPPKSYIYKSPYYLLSTKVMNKVRQEVFEEKKVETSYKSIETGRTKKIKIQQKSFDKFSSPLVFRNFLSFSVNENFTNEFYIDNEFWVSSITFMPHKELAGNEELASYEYQMRSTYKKPNAFYIK